MAGANKLLHLTAHGLVAFRGRGSKVVGTAVDIAVECAVVVVEGLDDAQRLLCGGRIVEVDQRMTVDLLLKDRELGTKIHFFFFLMK